MNHEHEFTDLVPSGSLEYVNLKCKDCDEIKTVDAIEYFNPPITYWADGHKI